MSDSVRRAAGRVLVAISAATIACSVFGPDGRLTASTERGEYVLPPTRDALVRAQLVNGTSATAVLVGCPTPPSVIVEQRVNGRWVEGTTRGLYCLAIYSATRVHVEPGDTLAFSMSMFSRGEFRLRVLIGEEWGEADRTIVSNTFVVR